MEFKMRWSSDQGLFPSVLKAQITQAFAELGHKKYAEFTWHFHHCLSLNSLPRKENGEIYIRVVPEGEMQFEKPEADWTTSGSLSLSEWKGVLDLLFRYAKRHDSKEISEIAETVGSLMKDLKEDLELLEKMHRGRLPKRFPTVKGMEVRSRYLAGLKPGGDFFDLAESEDGMRLHFVLTDASSYSLSSAVLNILMRVALRVSPGEGADPSAVLKRIAGEMAQVMKEKESLSICFGSISRKDWRLRFVHHGSNRIFLYRKEEGFTELAARSEPLRKVNMENTFHELIEIPLEPGDQLLVLSDGWHEALGEAKSMSELLERKRELWEKENLEDALTDLVYEVKQKWQAPDELPAQDCSILVFRMDSRMIRLASGN